VSSFDYAFVYHSCVYTCVGDIVMQAFV
jgi:hypothetical protein